MRTAGFGTSLLLSRLQIRYHPDEMAKAALPIPTMKTTLVAIMMTGLLAGLVDATPARNLNKRRAEKKRDAQKELAAAQANNPQPAQSQAAAAKPGAPVAQKPAKRTSTPSGSEKKQTAPSAPAPVVTAGPSELSRQGKPPSRRFFSRLRSDRDRDRAKAAKAAKRAAARGTAKPKASPQHIYRKSWGPRTHRRPR